MDLEQIYKRGLETHHEAGLQAVYQAGFTRAGELCCEEIRLLREEVRILKEILDRLPPLTYPATQTVTVTQGQP